MSDPTTGDLADVYREVCAGIRATDEVSLKLLAAVPLAAGIGIPLLVRSPSAFVPGVARCLLGLFAAVATFSIYRWERKNVATCSHLRRWAATLERDHFRLAPGESQRVGSAPHGAIPGPPFLGRQWGKTQAEALLYWAVILGWLVTAGYALTI
jgi:hypothetical protein